MRWVIFIIVAVTSIVFTLQQTDEAGGEETRRRRVDECLRVSEVRPGIYWGQDVVCTCTKTSKHTYRDMTRSEDGRQGSRHYVDQTSYSNNEQQNIGSNIPNSNDKGTRERSHYHRIHERRENHYGQVGSGMIAHTEEDRRKEINKAGSGGVEGGRTYSKESDPRLPRPEGSEGRGRFYIQSSREAEMGNDRMFEERGRNSGDRRIGGVFNVGYKTQHEIDAIEGEKKRAGTHFEVNSRTEGRDTFAGGVTRDGYGGMFSSHFSGTGGSGKEIGGSDIRYGSGADFSKASDVNIKTAGRVDGSGERTRGIHLEGGSGGLNLGLGGNFGSGGAMSSTGHKIGNDDSSKGYDMFGGGFRGADSNVQRTRGYGDAVGGIGVERAGAGLGPGMVGGWFGGKTGDREGSNTAGQGTRENIGGSFGSGMSSRASGGFNIKVSSGGLGHEGAVRSSTGFGGEGGVSRGYSTNGQEARGNFGGGITRGGIFGGSSASVESDIKGTAQGLENIAEGMGPEAAKGRVNTESTGGWLGGNIKGIGTTVQASRDGIEGSLGSGTSRGVSGGFRGDIKGNTGGLGHVIEGVEGARGTSTVLGGMGEVGKGFSTNDQGIGGGGNYFGGGIPRGMFGASSGSDMKTRTEGLGNIAGGIGLERARGRVNTESTGGRLGGDIRGIGTTVKGSRDGIEGSLGSGISSGVSGGFRGDVKGNTGGLEHAIEDVEGARGTSTILGGMGEVSKGFSTSNAQGIGGGGGGGYFSGGIPGGMFGASSGRDMKTRADGLGNIAGGMGFEGARGEGNAGSTDGWLGGIHRDIEGSHVAPTAGGIIGGSLGSGMFGGGVSENFGSNVKGSSGGFGYAVRDETGGVFGAGSTGLGNIGGISRGNITIAQETGGHFGSGITSGMLGVGSDTLASTMRGNTGGLGDISGNIGFGGKKDLNTESGGGLLTGVQTVGGGIGSVQGTIGSVGGVTATANQVHRSVSTSAAGGILAAGISGDGNSEDSNPKKEVESVTTAAVETTTEDYEEEEEEDCDGGIEIFNKIFCIFKIIAGLLFGNPDPCCPLEIPSFG